MDTTAASPVFAALDTVDEAWAARLAASLGGLVGGLKLGKAFFTARGPEGVRRVGAGHRLFLDLKFHDIPSTVAGAVGAAAALAPAIITVHASGGAAMMRAAVEAAAEETLRHGVPRPRIVAVTVLTSLDDGDLAAVGQAGPVADQVQRLAALAQACGLDGVVCSPREIAAVRRLAGPDFVLVVPGVRPAGSAAGDQKRTMTPAEAMALGATYLVIGRPLTGAADPAAAARAIAAEIAAVPAA
jgi:orotidine-5'-phosphate decarboxylase